MSDWKVFKTKIKLHTHSGADALELGKVGRWQVVVQKGLYNDGDDVVFVPKRSILPPEHAERFQPHLKGADKNRVGQVRLRGELSEGVILPLDGLDVPYDTDISEMLGITKYEPPIPVGFGGVLKRLPAAHFSKHDVEQFGIYATEFSGDEEVLVTEKLHGCVPSSTRITMHDGSQKRITQVKVGDYVLGMNPDGTIGPTKVTNTFNNGRLSEDERWLTVSVSNKAARHGGAPISLRLTGNHKVWSPSVEDYVKADSLRVGDELLLLTRDVELNYVQKEILKGKLLGDGHLQVSEGLLSGSARITFGQRAGDGYVDWCVQALGPIASRGADQTSGYGTVMERASTSMMTDIYDTFAPWIQDGVKQVPEDIKLSPLALAVWYMDDGSLGYADGRQNHTVNIATNGFNEASVDSLLTALEAQYDIVGQRYYASGWRIRLNHLEAEKFFLLVHPYIVDGLRHKIPKYYRNGSWTPSVEGAVSKLSQTRVVTINNIGVDSKISSNKYDIETETHNFFAGSILVHNSQTNISVFGGEFFITSKGLLGRGVHILEDETNIYWQGARNSGVLDALARFAGEDTQSVYQAIGEVVPAQGGNWTYGFGKPTILLFDVRVNGRSVPYDDVPEYLKEFWVPTIYRGAFKDADFPALSKGREQVSGKELHIREGIVVRPLVDRRAADGLRLMVKVISPTYAKKENGEEIS